MNTCYIIYRAVAFSYVKKAKAQLISRVFHYHKSVCGSGNYKNIPFSRSTPSCVSCEPSQRCCGPLLWMVVFSLQKWCLIFHENIHVYMLYMVFVCIFEKKRFCSHTLHGSAKQEFFFVF